MHQSLLAQRCIPDRVFIRILLNHSSKTANNATEPLKSSFIAIACFAGLEKGVPVAMRSEDEMMGVEVNHGNGSGRRVFFTKKNCKERIDYINFAQNLAAWANSKCVVDWTAGICVSLQLIYLLYVLQQVSAEASSTCAVPLPS